MSKYSLTGEKYEMWEIRGNPKSRNLKHLSDCNIVIFMIANRILEFRNTLLILMILKFPLGRKLSCSEIKNNK